MIDKRIANFLKELMQFRSSDTVYNQYSQSDEIPYNNLKIYLNLISNTRVRYLFVGEAPGYRGCKLTGISFTSEHILLTNPYSSVILGKDKGYKSTNVEKMNKERTATLFWKEVVKIDSAPLLWNAFPFSPFVSGELNSNRAPNKDEIKIGVKLLKDLIEIYKPKKIISVGNKASSALELLNIRHSTIVHPSFDIKQQFKLQVARLNSKN